MPYVVVGEVRGWELGLRVVQTKYRECGVWDLAWCQGPGTHRLVLLLCSKTAKGSVAVGHYTCYKLQIISHLCRVSERFKTGGVSNG